MKINKHMSRVVSAMLSLAMAFGSVLPTQAAEVIISESLLEETELAEPVINGAGRKETESELEAYADIESRYEQIEVTYSQSSSYFVTIPKTITLGADKKSPYSIKVEGDIVANKQVCVVPADGITDTEVFDFYMSDQIAGSTKEDVAAEISQSKFYWDHEEAARGYEETDNYIVAEGLSAGKWKGTFQMEISMRTDPSHIHNYVGEVTKEPTCTETGEKTYTCDCGDSYMESIDPTGHHYENGECTNCGEKDPDHEHSYTEEITKQPTCTEEGEKTYTCICGDSYTEKIPATGHHFVNGECEDCGEKDPDHEHSYTEMITKEPTCTEAGEKTYTCECGDSYTEEIPATGHDYKEEVTKEPTCTEAGEKTYTCECGNSYTEEIPATGHHYEDGICTNCGEKDPDAFEKIKVGDTETRVIAGQTLEFICIDDAYVDATGEAAGALFIAKSFIPGLAMSTNPFVKDWASNNVRAALNSDTSDFSNLVYVDTTITKSYSGDKTATNYNMDTISSYGAASDYDAPKSEDRVFILSLEEAIKYNKVNINGKEISVMWDLNCDGTVEFNKYSGYWGHYLRTPSTSKSAYYAIGWTGAVLQANNSNNGIRPCYVKDNGFNIHSHSYAESITKEPTCTEDGEKTFTCTCGSSYTETIPATGHHYENDICTGCGREYVNGGLYDENDVMIASWDELVNDYGLRIEKNYMNYNNPTNKSTQTSLYYILANNEELKDGVKLIISESEKYIGSYAIANCENLHTVIIPDSVTSTGMCVFRYCTGLEKVEIPNSMTCIESHTFDYCSNLTHIELPDSITEMKEYAFANTGLTEMVIPEKVDFLGHELFYNTQLTEAIIPEHITAIGNGTFENCKNLTKAVIPDSVASMGYYAFRNCDSLTDVKLSKNVQKIDEQAFGGCIALTQITIPDGVTAIYKSAFNGCSSLVDITLPDSLTNISDAAFGNCTSLSNIYIPISVVSVSGLNNYGESPFYGGYSPSLKIYCGADSKPNGWGKYWNYYGSYSSYPVIYGVARDEYNSIKNQ